MRRPGVLAVEGSRASLIGGPPAGAVVFAAEVSARTDADPRVADLAARLDGAGDQERARRRAELAEVRSAVRSEKLGEVAAEFDRIHSIERARRWDRSTPSSRRPACALSWLRLWSGAWPGQDVMSVDVTQRVT